MKVLITGATGLIGKELVSLLLKHNYQINYLSTSTYKIEDSKNCHGFYWNPLTGDIDKGSFIGVDAIIHLAGASVDGKWTNTYKQDILFSRMFSTELLYHTLKKNAHQVKQIIAASGISIYPTDRKEDITEECVESDNSFLATVVYKNENSLDTFEKLNIKICKIRTCAVLSTRGGILPKIIKPVKMGFGAAFGSGNQIMSWIHIEDICNMYLYALQNNLEGIYNAVAPEKTSNKNFMKKVAAKFQKKVLLPNVPKFMAKVLFGEKSHLMLDSKIISSQKIIDHGFDFKYKTLDKALDNLISD